MLVLDEAAVTRVLTPALAYEAVRTAFLSAGDPALPATGKIDALTAGGEFHVKAGAAPGWYAVKANSGFFGPSAPGIRGVVVAFRLGDGTPAAVLSSGRLTAVRTGAAAAVAADALARGAVRLGLLGAGRQARAALEALAARRDLEQVDVWTPTGRTEALSAWCAERSLPCTTRSSPADVTRDCPLVVTATPSRAPLVAAEDVPAGAVVIALGADSPGKQELPAALLLDAAVVVDVEEQCRASGELQHAPRAAVAATLTDVLRGRVALGSGRVVVLDATGTGFQDAAVAGAVVTAFLAGG